MTPHEEFHLYIPYPVSFGSLFCYQLLDQLDYKPLVWLGGVVTEMLRSSYLLKEKVEEQVVVDAETSRALVSLASENEGLIEVDEMKALAYGLNELFQIVKTSVNKALPSANPERLQAVGFTDPATVIVSYFTVKGEHRSWHLPLFTS